MGYEVKIASCENALGTACMELGNEEYVYHFNILHSLNEYEAIKLLEEVKKVFLTSKSKVYGIS
ncbi:aspartate phosphatase [Bacillus thuringiensis]|uniref:aspartate phosphatase n=1 Tax=Bacillus thuringiensis TaxID=1428 RepID=UPI0011423E84|nr:aspartate phosphatase [Bacillus thuringiensis]